MKNPFAAYLKVKPRMPATKSHLIVMTGAIIIGTEDGNNVVITSKVARELAPLLPMLADKADQAKKEAVID